MKKFYNKIFITILTILTLSFLSYVIVFNVSGYIKEKTSITNSLKTASTSGKIDKDKPAEIEDRENIKFIDNTVYTVLLSSSNQIIDVINNSNIEVSDSEIERVANNILNSDTLEESYVKFLYFNNYSYYFVDGNYLIIFDNSEVQKTLYISLFNSLLLFVILELIAIIIARKIAKLITKPVIESFNKQKEFVADASHELKTPLSVIMASSDALEKNKNEDKWLKNIKIECERMNNLITNLLNLASSENKEKEMNVGNLSKVIELATLTFEGKAYEMGLKLVYDIEDNIMFKMNENSINELVEIMLDNALKHAYDGSEINISLKNDNNNIELLVINEGDKIPEGCEEKIFERFYRVSKSRNRSEGRYGLGLAIAKNIVHNHKGVISAMSSNGKTTFKVVFKNKI